MLLSLALTILMIVSSLFLFVSADKTEGENDRLSTLNFSDSRLDNNKKITPSELLAMLTDNSVSRLERDYLDSYYDGVLLYNDFVTAKNFNVSFTKNGKG